MANWSLSYKNNTSKTYTSKRGFFSKYKYKTILWEKSLVMTDKKKSTNRKVKF